MNVRRRICVALALGGLASGCSDDVSADGADTTSTTSGSTGAGASSGETSTDSTGTSGPPADSSDASTDVTTRGETTESGGTGETSVSVSTEGTDASDSTTAADPVCGDGVVDDGEACDTDALGDNSCQTQGFVDGALACLADCSDFDTSACTVAGDCCDPHGTVGCADAVCEDAICGADAFCCEDHWDGLCSDAALGAEACLDVGGACPCPDEAIFDATGPAVTTGDTTGDDDDFDTSCGGTDGNDHVVYFIAPDVGTYTFDTFGSSYDTKLAVRTDCATEAACNDDAAGGVQSEVTLDLVSGQRIRLVIDGYNGAVGEWILNVTAAPILPPECGDADVDAPEICDGDNLNGQTCAFQGFGGGGQLACAADCLTFDTSGCIDGPYPCSDESIAGATGPAVTSGDTGSDDDDLGASCGGGDGNDHVVTFTAPAAGLYVFDTFGSAYDTKLSLYADCESELYCNDDAGGLQSEIAINMGAGQDVLVVVDGFDGSTGVWVLNVTPP